MIDSYNANETVIILQTLGQILYPKEIKGFERFIIPRYQRRYCWTKTQWESLILDIFNNKNLFLGILIFQKIFKEKTFELSYVLIDGQQRITTLWLLWQALLRYEPKQPKSENRIKIDKSTLESRKVRSIDFVSKLDSVLFEKLEELFDEQESKQNIKKTEENLFYKNFVSLKTYLSDFLDTQEKFDLFVDNLLNAKFATWSVGDEEDVHKIYSTINTSGVKLKSIDLVKNFLVTLIKDLEKADSLFLDYWPCWEEQKIDLTKVIRTFVSYKKQSVINESEIYKNFKDWANDVVGNEPSNAEKVWNEVDRFHKKMMNLYSNSLSNDKLIKEELDTYLKLPGTSADSFLIELLGSKVENKNRSSEINIIKWTNSFIARAIIKNISISVINWAFVSLYQKVENHNKQNNFPTFYDAFKDYLKLHPFENVQLASDEEIRTSFRDDNFYSRDIKKSLVKSFLYLWEKAKSKEIAELSSNLSIEHIAPQNAKGSNWIDLFGSNDVYSSYLHKIGNLTLTGHNTELGNLDFESKKAILKNREKTKFLLINEYVIKCDTWSKDQINERSQIMATKFIEMFPYQNIGFSAQNENIPEYKNLLSNDDVNTQSKDIFLNSITADSSVLNESNNIDKTHIYIRFNDVPKKGSFTKITYSQIAFNDSKIWRDDRQYSSTRTFYKDIVKKIYENYPETLHKLAEKSTTRRYRNTRNLHEFKHNRYYRLSDDFIVDQDLRQIDQLHVISDILKACGADLVNSYVKVETKDKGE
ncbi:DUF262 domain-containing protein [Mycoplasma sp. 4044]